MPTSQNLCFLFPWAKLFSSETILVATSSLDTGHQPDIHSDNSNNLIIRLHVPSEPIPFSRYYRSILCGIYHLCKKIRILFLIICLSVAYVHKSQCAPRRQSRLPYPLELDGVRGSCKLLDIGAENETRVL